ncbi:nuclear transport factor 2 family protein [Rhodococcus qingshengii]|uniref:nuclear transport factor 2 family protein n=1 Tax=Rhodococcus qingshengii TaxID=334542 RepID=UPI00365C8916
MTYPDPDERCRIVHWRLLHRNPGSSKPLRHEPHALDILSIPPTVYESLRALNACDIEACLKTLTPNPSLVQADCRLQGLNAIRGWIWSNRDRQGAGPRIDVLECSARDNRATVEISWTTFGLTCESTVEFQLEDDKIASIVILSSR